MARTVRIVTTNDFFGCFAPAPTSYGALAGGDGLRRAVERLRAGQPTIWADTGDFSQSGPLSALSRGRLGFRAAAELGIDVAAVGNHDLDFGLPLLREEAPGLGFPLLCANAPLGLPPTAILPTGAGDIGFVGLTYPALPAMAPYSLTPARALPTNDRDLAGAARAAAVDLRAAGVAAVVALLHDGIDGRLAAAGAYVADPARLRALCRPWAGVVDAILLGHTCGRYMGDIAGTPVVQPWPFGAEVGVLDLEIAPGAPPRVVAGTPRGELVPPGDAWAGAGGDLLAAAGARVLGVLDEPLHDRMGGGVAPLADFLARAIRAATGVDAALAHTQTGQPTLDGVFAALPRGPVTALQLLQVMPWADGRLVRGVLDRAELAAVVAGLRPPAGRAARVAVVDVWTGLQANAFGWGLDENLASGTRGTATVAVPAGHAPVAVDAFAGRAIAWEDAGAAIDDAVRAALAVTR